MKTSIVLGYFLILSFLSFQCKNSKNETLTKSNILSDTYNSEKEKNVRKDGTIPKISFKLTWVDSLIVDYIYHSNNKLLRLARKADINEQWILDTSSREGKIYIVAEIGRENEFRFVPEAWLYIDTLTKNIFEYDVANDYLLKWER